MRTTAASLAAIDALGCREDTETGLIEATMTRLRASLAPIKKDKRLLVSSDLSGIQRFVYAIGTRGALKSLRARSFLVRMLVEHVVAEVEWIAYGSAKEPLGLSVIHADGGGSSAIVPDTDEVRVGIQEFVEHLNRWLWEETQGSLSLAVALTGFRHDQDPCSPDFGMSLRADADRALQLSKQSPFSPASLLDLCAPREPGQMQFDRVCRITGRDDFLEVTDLVTGSPISGSPSGEQVAVSPSAYRLFHFGDALLNADRVIRQSNQPNRRAWLSFPDRNGRPAFYSVLEAGDSLPEGVDAVWVVDDDRADRFKDNRFRLLVGTLHALSVSDLPESAQAVERLEGFLGSSAKDTTASMAGLANSARGASLVGALQADADAMGKTLDDAIRLNGLPGLMAVSRRMAQFFGRVVPELCRGNASPYTGSPPYSPISYPDGESPPRFILPIFSGGDDLFVVGAWSDIAEFAVDLHRAYTGFPGLSGGLSVGMTVHKPGAPLFRMAREAATALSISKTGGQAARVLDIPDHVSLFHSSARSLRKLEREARAKEERGSDPEAATRLELSMPWSDLEPLLVRVFADLPHLALRATNGSVAFQSERTPSGLPFRLLGLLETWRDTGRLALADVFWLAAKLQLDGDQTARFASLFRDATPDVLHVPLTWMTLLLRSSTNDS